MPDDDDVHGSGESTGYAAAAEASAAGADQHSMAWPASSSSSSSSLHGSSSLRSPSFASKPKPPPLRLNGLPDGTSSTDPYGDFGFGGGGGDSGPQQRSSWFTQDIAAVDPYDELVKRVNRLQEYIARAGLLHVVTLPRIVVVGDQSSGKSSLLERIARMPPECRLLPCGQNMVTRSPICIQMIHDPDANPPWASISVDGRADLTESQVECTNIAQRIEKITNIIAPNKSLSQSTITVRLRSSQVTTLTLVDLPGLIGTNVEGVEPEHIKELVKKELKSSNTLVLCVLSGMNDLSTAHFGPVLRETQKEHQTIFVVNKMDGVRQMGGVSELIQRALQGEGRLGNYKTGMGVFGTCCAVPGRGLLTDDEEMHVLMDLKLPRVSTDVLGVGNLTTTLATQLHRHIQATSGRIRADLEEMVKETRRELRTIEPPADPSEELLIHLLSSVTRNIRLLLSGDATDVGSIGLPSEGGLSDPHAAGGHLVYARAITGKLYEGLDLLVDRWRHKVDEHDDAWYVSHEVSANGAHGPRALGHRVISNLLKQTISQEELRRLCMDVAEEYATAMRTHVFDHAAVVTSNGDELKPVDIRQQYPNLWGSFRQALDEALEMYRESAEQLAQDICALECKEIDHVHPFWPGRDDPGNLALRPSRNRGVRLLPPAGHPNSTINPHIEDQQAPRIVQGRAAGGGAAGAATAAAAGPAYGNAAAAAEGNGDGDFDGIQPATPMTPAGAANEGNRPAANGQRAAADAAADQVETLEERRRRLQATAAAVNPEFRPQMPQNVMAMMDRAEDLEVFPQRDTRPSRLYPAPENTPVVGVLSEEQRADLVFALRHAYESPAVVNAVAMCVEVARRLQESQRRSGPTPLYGGSVMVRNMMSSSAKFMQLHGTSLSFRNKETDITSAETYNVTNASVSRENNSSYFGLKIRGQGFTKQLHWQSQTDRERWFQRIFHAAAGQLQMLGADGIEAEDDAILLGNAPRSARLMTERERSEFVEDVQNLWRDVSHVLRLTEDWLYDAQGENDSHDRAEKYRSQLRSYCDIVHTNLAFLLPKVFGIKLRDPFENERKIQAHLFGRHFPHDEKAFAFWFETSDAISSLRRQKHALEQRQQALEQALQLVSDV